MKTISQFRLWLDEIKLSQWLNKYTVTLSVFFIWMMFFDQHNMIVQYRLNHTSNQLKEQIQRHRQLRKEAKDEMYVLRTTPEKYAREKYLMHKPDEEVFVVVRE
jgi:cell division protein DivIC